SPDFPRKRRLTGLLHGAAGAAFALLELFAATGEDRYRLVAEQAFAYERFWFDAGAHNWPDFRKTPLKGRDSRPPVYGMSWCHGAPGIAWSRLRAYALLKDASYREEATTALATTQSTLERLIDSYEGNFSLCHGLAGNAEVFLYGEEVLQERWRDRT